jgi:hypothetical protein
VGLTPGTRSQRATACPIHAESRLPVLWPCLAKTPIFSSFQPFFSCQHPPHTLLQPTCNVLHSFHPLTCLNSPHIHFQAPTPIFNTPYSFFNGFSTYFHDFPRVSNVLHVYPTRNVHFRSPPRIFDPTCTKTPILGDF